MSRINFSEADLFRVKVADLKHLYTPEHWPDYWLRYQYEKTSATLQNMVRDQSIKPWGQGDINFSRTKPGNSHAHNKTDQGINNVIAITGDRGSGKSTFLYSIKENLAGTNEDRMRLDLLANDFNKAIDQSAEMRNDLQYSRFHVLQPLDPNNLIEKESLLGHVVAQIYRVMQQTAEKKLESLDRLEKLVGLCQSTYDAIRTRLTSLPNALVSNPDDLEMLGRLSNSSDLKRHLADLIDEFLRVVAPLALENDDPIHGEPTPAFLVIPIDDLDTCTKYGYELAEEIRNFFFMPQVIIIMAVKIEQLVDVVHQHFISAFQKLLAPPNPLDAQPEEMATKYIQKLIPDQRRIHLPTLSSDSIRNVHIQTKKSGDFISVADYFLSLIWKKTRILLTKNASSSHGLIPLNLRSLHQCILEIEGLPDITLYPGVTEGGSDDRQALDLNLKRIEAWLLDSVSSNAVPRGMALIVKKLASHSNDNLCGFLRGLLIEYEAKLQRERLDENGKIVHWGLWGGDETAQTTKGNGVRPENVSLGDILYLLDAMERYNSDDGILHFTASVRMLLSIRLTRILVMDEKPDYRAAFDLINGMIYNHNIPLTTTKQEWIPNIDITPATVIHNGQTLYFDTKDPKTFPDRKPSPPMSLDDAVWLSMHIAHYGNRLPGKQLINFREGAYARTKLVPWSDDRICFVCISWLAFIANTLIPDETAERLFNALSIKIERYKDESKLLDHIINWRNKYYAAIPLHSTDVIQALITSMHESRFDVFKSNYILELSAFFFMTKQLRKSMLSIRNKVAIKKTKSTEADKQPLDNRILRTMYLALAKCPAFNPADKALAEYQNKSESARKFDWFAIS
ncbi:MAG: KAP family P-loop domain protein [Solidesulfovibrio magneticus str. Maddingley MBC34]|uniref:KAP family P-loop domain protein n=1 Tax=Solidesulfovibrio magneticus str. Maddingley MBC34 TaxID=1206767 RepID=K6GFS1_9BACT|nr:MAG: KAP family P-loop domain protein [Solidesulfovibrio magneticus str. Maddingley MBC34]